MERIARVIWEDFRAGEDKRLSYVLYCEYLVLKEEGSLYTSMYGADIRTALCACAQNDSGQLSRMVEKIYQDYAYKGEL